MARKSEQEKREIISRYQASGQTQRAFVASEGISEYLLSKWLNHNDTEARPTFVEVPIAMSTEVEIRFRDGSVIMVRS